MIKGTTAVIAGFLVVVAFSMGTDKILETTGIFPRPTGGLYITWMLALALVYRTVYTILGGYITAWISGSMKAVWVLAILGQIGGIMGVVVGWNLSSHWYPIALAVLAIPSVWLGGWLRLRSGKAAADVVA